MPNYILSVLQNKCPRCRTGKIFKTNNAYDFKNHLKMEKDCPVCGQPTEIEVGFYYGTGYVSYALTVAFSVATFLAWWVILGISINDNSLFWWLGVNAFLLLVLQPFLMRLARTMWLGFFVIYDKNWKDNTIEKSDRIIESQMENI